MTENMAALQEAKRLLGIMIQLVRVYERGTIGDPAIFQATLTASDITSLKQAFAAIRTDCITEINKVTG